MQRYKTTTDMIPSYVTHLSWRVKISISWIRIYIVLQNEKVFSHLIVTYVNWEFNHREVNSINLTFDNLQPRFGNFRTFGNHSKVPYCKKNSVLNLFANNLCSFHLSLPGSYADRKEKKFPLFQLARLGATKISQIFETRLLIALQCFYIFSSML